MSNGSIKVDIKRNIAFYFWYNIYSNRYPDASKQSIVKMANESAEYFFK